MSCNDDVVNNNHDSVDNGKDHYNNNNKMNSTYLMVVGGCIGIHNVNTNCQNTVK